MNKKQLDDFYEVLERCGSDEISAVSDMILFNAGLDYKKMTADEFLNHTVACGGNWGAMFLFGMKDCYPHVYDTLPEKIGKNGNAAFCVIAQILDICGVQFPQSGIE